MPNLETVSVITDSKNGTRWLVFRDGDNYGFTYSEFYRDCGWRELFTETGYSREAIEMMFEEEVA